MKAKTGTLFLGAIILFSGCTGGDKNRIAASGTIEATEVNIASKASGQIKKIFVTEGGEVVENGQIAEIDHSTLDLQLAQAKAGFNLAQAQLDLLVNGARQEDVRAGEENLKQAEASHRLAKSDNERMQELDKTKAITKRQLDDSQARFDITQAQYAQAKETLNKLKQWSRPEDIRAAEARMDQAKAAVDILKKNIEDSFIKSPVEGTVISIPVEAGELVGPGAVLCTVAQLKRVYLVIYLTEVELGRAKLNQEAGVRIDSYPDRVFNGRIVYISPVAEFTPKNIQTKEDRVKLVFRAKIEVDNAEGILKPGLPADAILK